MKALKYLLIIFSVFVFSCKTKQLIIRETNTKVDTLIIQKSEKVYQAVHDTMTIENPCDSLGILKSFHSRIITPIGKIEIRSKKGNIVATVNLDSIKTSYEKQYKSKSEAKTNVSEKIITKEVVPFWAIIMIFFESVIILGYFYIKVMKPFS